MLYKDGISDTQIGKGFVTKFLLFAISALSFQGFEIYLHIDRSHFAISLLPELYAQKCSHLIFELNCCLVENLTLLYGWPMITTFLILFKFPIMIIHIYNSCVVVCHWELSNENVYQDCETFNVLFPTKVYLLSWNNLLTAQFFQLRLSIKPLLEWTP